MRAIIIAGGLGTRLRPLTYNLPKPIVPVANRPFVLHQIELLKRYGITEIVLLPIYLSEEIKEIFDEGKKFGVKVYYSIEEKPLGTAGAVKNAEEFFTPEPMIVFNGDILTDINLKDLIEAHYKKKARVTLALTEVEDPTTYGLVLTDETGRVTRFIEKPSWEQVTARTVNAGIYVLDPGVFEEVPRGLEYSFERQLYPHLLEREEPIYGFVSQAYWIDIGSPQKYMQAHRGILRQEVRVHIPGKKNEDGVWIGKNTYISPSAKVNGPSLLGDGVQIGDEVRVQDLVVLGENVSVDEGSSLDHSIIWRGTAIGKEVKLSNCLVGINCRIEDGAEIAGMVLADNCVIKKGSRMGVKL